MKRWEPVYQDLIRYKDKFMFLHSHHDIRENLNHFCNTCINLANWLDDGKENGPAYAHLRNNEHLNIARAIANGTKHCELQSWRYNNKAFRVNTGFQLVQSSTGFMENMSTFDDLDLDLNKWDIEVTSLSNPKDSKQYKLMDFVDKCFSSWNRYLRENLMI